jgi:hypothetical protein
MLKALELLTKLNSIKLLRAISRAHKIEIFMLKEEIDRVYSDSCE